MTEQERNFRSQYYEKVGFRGVEEKRSIESLLKEQPMKQDKLVQFCLQFGLPDMYRLYVWKILLGVLPVDQMCQDFVWFHRQEQVKELERAAILLCPDCIDGPQELRLLVMKLIEEGGLPMRQKGMTSQSPNPHFMAVVRTISGLVTSETDLFWVSTRFFRHFTTTLGSWENFPEYSMRCLKKEDKNQKLYQHLRKHHIESALPLKDWFGQCFACVLPETAVERVWDRVICGSSYFLVFIPVAIFQVLRRPLLAMHKSGDIVKYLSKIPDDCGDRIVNDALNLCQEYGQFWLEKEDSSALSGGAISSRPSTDCTRQVAKSLQETGRPKSMSETSRPSVMSLTEGGSRPLPKSMSEGARPVAKSMTDGSRHSLVLASSSSRSSHSPATVEKNDGEVTVTFGSGSLSSLPTRKSPSTLKKDS